MACSNPKCTPCARAFWAWWKARMAQMNKPRKGETTSFAEAASTSVVPRPGIEPG